MPLVYNYKSSRDCYVVSGLNVNDITLNSIPTFYNDGVNGTKNVREIADFAFRNNVFEFAIIPSGIDYIGNSAFLSSPYLKDVFILDSPLRIGPSAFRSCSILTGVFFGTGLIEIGDEAFRSCSSLQTINFPESLSGINSNAFNGCTNLSGSNLTGKTDFLYLPKKLKTLGSGAFSSCSFLKEVRIPSNDLKILGAEAFSNTPQLDYCILNKSGITGMQRGVFYFSNIKTFAFPETYTQINIPDRAFSNCNELKYVHMPSGIKTIGAHAFFLCSKMENFKLSNDISTIENYAFQDAGKTSWGSYENFPTALIDNIFLLSGDGTGINDLIKIDNIYPEPPFTFPTGVALIRENCLLNVPIPSGRLFIPEKLNSTSRFFGSNMFLTGVEVHPLNPHFSGYKGLVYNKAGNNLLYAPTFLSGLGTIEIKSGTTVINNNVFFDSTITGISLPSGLLSIGATAFTSSDLEAIDLPDTINNIGIQCFSSSKLTGIKLPANLTILQELTFVDCASLKNVKIPDRLNDVRIDTSSATTSRGPFSNCRNLERIDIGSGLASFRIASLFGELIPFLPFQQPYKLTGIFISEENPFIRDIDGIVYTKNSGTLVYYPPGRDTFDGYNLEENIYSPPYYVNTIGANAFWFSSQLKKVFLDNNISTVREKAFNNCLRLKEITFSSGNLGFQTIVNAPSLTGLFFKETGRFTLDIQRVVRSRLSPSIPAHFLAATGVKNIFIPSGMTFISGLGPGVYGASFYDFSGLEAVNVSEAHPFLSSVDGILYNKDQTQTIIFPPQLQGDIFIPDGITGMNDLTFSNSKISSINFGTGIKQIGRLFLNCQNLTGIQIGDSVTGVGSPNGAVATNCPKLTKVHFGNKVRKLFGNTLFSLCPAVKDFSYHTGDYEYDSFSFVVNIIGGFPRYSGNYIEEIRKGFTYLSPLGLVYPRKIIRYSTDINNNKIIHHINFNYDNNYPLATTSQSNLPAFYNFYGNVDSRIGTIPEKLFGSKVIAITGFNSGVFSLNDTLTHRILIPTGINVILEDIPNSSFGVSGFLSLTGISIGSGSNLYSEDGILYDKNKNRIIAVPRACTENYLCLDKNLKFIHSDAFAFNQSLTGISFKGDLPFTGKNIFTGVTNDIKIYRKKDVVTGWSENFDRFNVYYKHDNTIKTGQNIGNKFIVYSGGNGKLTTHYYC